MRCHNAFLHLISKLGMVVLKTNLTLRPPDNKRLAALHVLAPRLCWLLVFSEFLVLTEFTLVMVRDAFAAQVCRSWGGAAGNNSLCRTRRQQQWIIPGPQRAGGYLSLEGRFSWMALLCRPSTQSNDRQLTVKCAWALGCTQTPSPTLPFNMLVV